MQSEEPKLRNCPFCGCDNLYFVHVNGYLDTTVGIFCNGCKVTVLYEGNHEEGDTPESRRRAIEAWNRRVNDAE